MGHATRITSFFQWPGYTGLLVLTALTGCAHAHDVVAATGAPLTNEPPSAEIYESAGPTEPYSNLPHIIRFMRAGDQAPSCALVWNTSFGLMAYELASPEPSFHLPACAPGVTMLGRLPRHHAYVLYRYRVEDPRHDVHPMYQLVKTHAGGFAIRGNDDDLTHAALSRMARVGALKAFAMALAQVGCQHPTEVSSVSTTPLRNGHPMGLLPLVGTHAGLIHEGMALALGPA